MKWFIMILALFLVSLTSCTLKCAWTEEGACEAYVEAIDTKFNECTDWVYDIEVDIIRYCSQVEEKCVDDNKVDNCLNEIENASCDQIFIDGGLYPQACEGLSS